MHKRLLITTGVYPPESGGPATYTKLLAERLPPLGFSVRVLPFRAVRHLPPGVRHVAYFFTCLALARRADIIYAQDTVSVGLPAALAALVLRKKFIVRVPGDYAWEQGRQRFGVADELDPFQRRRYGFRTELLRGIQRFVVHRAAAVVVPSAYMKNIVQGWLGPSRVEGGKIHTIYSGIEAPQPARVERSSGFLVVSSGRRVPWKHFDAIERVVKREPQWHFHLAADVSREEALGWVKAADVFVLNSTYEGLSHALVEAMMLGTPVVATRVGGNPELIEDDVDGLLIAPKDDEALYRALKRVANNKEEARARAEAARAKTKRFSADTAIRQVADLLEQL